MKTNTHPLFWIVLILTCSSAAFACINPIGRSTVGTPIYVEKHSPQEFLTALITHPNQAYWKDILVQLRAERTRFPVERIENKTNTAVAMLHLGMVKEAIEILERLEKEQPGRYYTAANLGTAYELNGENAKALKWIKEGVTRNPDAHHGSEWLHVKVLEAKIALEKDPNWLASHSVLGINRVPHESISSSPTATDHLGQVKDIKEIEAALVYQLHERLEFIKPPEGVVANLLFDLSRILSIGKGQGHAGVVAEFAQTYGSDLMPWSRPEPPVPAVAVPPVSTTPYWIVGAAIVLFVSLAAIIMVLRRRRTLS